MRSSPPGLLSPQPSSCVQWCWAVLCHDDIGYSYLTTQLRQNIVDDDKKLRFLHLNHGNNVVQYSSPMSYSVEGPSNNLDEAKLENRYPSWGRSSRVANPLRYKKKMPRGKLKLKRYSIPIIRDAEPGKACHRAWRWMKILDVSVCMKRWSVMEGWCGMTFNSTGRRSREA